MLCDYVLGEGQKNLPPEACQLSPATHGLLVLGRFHAVEAWLTSTSLATC